MWLQSEHSTYGAPATDWGVIRRFPSFVIVSLCAVCREQGEKRNGEWAIPWRGRCYSPHLLMKGVPSLAPFLDLPTIASAMRATAGPPIPLLWSIGWLCSDTASIVSPEPGASVEFLEGWRAVVVAATAFELTTLSSTAAVGAAVSAFNRGVDKRRDWMLVGKREDRERGERGEREERERRERKREWVCAFQEKRYASYARKTRPSR